MTEVKVRKVCEKCGSDQVSCDALARWNNDTQAWELSGLLDNTDCDYCADECHVEDVVYDPDDLRCSYCGRLDLDCAAKPCEDRGS